MQITLSKTSDVPLRQQLAEQIVFLITTGQLQPGEELPSVRALARLSKVHHNTVSEAYQDLVRRGWVTRRRGSRLMVGTNAGHASANPRDLDELINQTIQRARQMGHSLQALRQRVRERLMAQLPDHLLVIENEPGLRGILQAEIRGYLGWPVESCSYEAFAGEPALAIGAQVVAANHLIEEITPMVPRNRPAIGLVYARPTEHLDLVRNLHNPSIVAVVSGSESLLRTARGLLAPAIGMRHTFSEVLADPDAAIRLGSADVVFCDTITFAKVHFRRKILYRLIDPECLEHLAASLSPS
ncbi:MAG TPA: GntR family transcriptional regulator [Acidobacteriaceae bacterium]|nr:GntR family transcriptional regulator [Acidobacteriaceae bacterium]